MRYNLRKYRKDNHIKKIQDVYKIEQPDEEQPMVVDKGKQKEDWIQEEEVFYTNPITYHQSPVNPKHWNSYLSKTKLITWKSIESSYNHQ